MAQFSCYPASLQPYNESSKLRWKHVKVRMETFSQEGRAGVCGMRTPDSSLLAALNLQPAPQAAKFMALAGSRPLEPMLLLQNSELLHDDNFFTGPPDQAFVHDDANWLHM